MKGEKGIFAEREPLYLIMSSGTTSGKKYIPTTKTGLNLYLSGMRDSIFSYIHSTGNYDLFDGKILTFPGNPRLERVGSVYTGRISSVLNYHVPWYLKSFQLPSRQTAKAIHWREKVVKMVAESERHSVTAFCGLPIWIQDYLTAISEKNQKPVLELFPKLKVFVHGGLSIKPYQHHINDLIHPEKKIDYLEVYNASEAFIAFQDNLNDPSLLLHLNTGIFYEFIPVSELSLANPKRLRLSEVKKGQNYALVLNTCSGLLGYLIGDTIRFTSTCPYKIIWTGRTQQFASAFNEHVILEEVETAISEAVKSTGLKVVEFTVAPVFNFKKTGVFYEWCIEFESEKLSTSDIQIFARKLDQSVSTQNHLYRELRQASILKIPKVTMIKQNGFYQYMKRQDKLGDQYKMIHLSNDNTILTEISEWKR